mgnify:CR=1 FL=1
MSRPVGHGVHGKGNPSSRQALGEAVWTPRCLAGELLLLGETPLRRPERGGPPSFLSSLDGALEVAVDPGLWSLVAELSGACGAGARCCDVEWPCLVGVLGERGDQWVGWPAEVEVEEGETGRPAVLGGASADCC